MESQDQRLSTEVVTMQPTGSSVALASPQDTAAICGLLSRNFVDGIKQDQYPGIFTFESDGSIRHDSDKMPFFSRKKKIAGISFPTAESTEICCRSIDDLRRLKERLLNNRFMFKGKMYVVNGQFSGIQCRVHESGVFSVDPRHPDIAEQLISAFDKAEEFALSGSKYEVQINFDFSVVQWFERFALENLTDQIIQPGSRAFATFSITNATHKVQWCGECSQPRILTMGCICVLPFWVPCCCVEKTYRQCVYKKHMQVIGCTVATL